jgi:hypothetical protein
MTLSVQTLDRKIWRKDLVISYLHHHQAKNLPAVIDFGPEGSCAEALGLYRLLDEFCGSTGYNKQHITVRTANALEQHDHYRVVFDSNYWYEIDEINHWAKDKVISNHTHPGWHFANFVSRSNWFRLWIATILDTQHKNKTLQTYHYDPTRENYNANGYLGLDDLFQFGCNIVSESAKFLTTCPRTLDLEFLKNRDYSDSLFQHVNSYYPIQHPANLNLLQYYNKIFVDIVCEPNASGRCFLPTEKIWRPILARRPFIVMSNFEYLQNLRRLGFKTFNDYWDENYDDYCEGDRIRMIEQVLKTISLWTVQELHNSLIDMQSILDHNYYTFRNLTNQQIQLAFTHSTADLN